MKIVFSEAKALIFVLVFLGYAYSGDGTGILKSIKDAALSALSENNIFSDIIANVAKKFKNVRDIVTAAVEEDCNFTCPTGFQITPNQQHIPTYDGCGSLGLHIKPYHFPEEATKCCNIHDLCYDVCNVDKEKCDLEFKRCLYRLCDNVRNSTRDGSLKGCKVGAKALSTGAQELGCQSYLVAQEKACLCTPFTKKKYRSGGQWRNIVPWRLPQLFYGRPPVDF